VPHQVGDEDNGALEHPDENQVLAVVVTADLLAELGDAPLEVGALHKDPADPRSILTRLHRAQAIGA
jgi:hypothetical protein